MSTDEEITLDASTVYLLPGLRGSLTSGLGAELQRLGLSVTGRETVGNFDQLPFVNKVEAIANDLQTHFWHPDAKVVANSFGAYLFLNAQALLDPFPGKVLLLSALLGEGEDPVTGRAFSLPRSESLQRLLASGRYPLPCKLQVHVGELDWQANPDRWKALAPEIGVDLYVVPEQGHRLDHGYVRSLLERWIS